VEAPYRRPLVIPLSSVAADGIELRCFPSDDAAFAAFVDTALAGSAEAELTPATLERRLRPAHPHARVREQSALGTLSPGYVIWYVFRDG
jgi:hypothetical protein